MALEERLIESLVRRTIDTAEARLRKYVFTPTGEKRPERKPLTKLKENVELFLQTRENSLLVLYGLRGVGKTTMLAQIYFKLLPQIPRERLVYVSLDKLRSLGISLNDFVRAYERLLGERIEELSQPTFLFIDEAHYDENFGITVKDLHDSVSNLMIVVTGSSSLPLKLDPDLMRRARKLRVPPLTFTEYLLLKKKIQIPEELSAALKRAFLSCDFSEIEEQLGGVLLKFTEKDVEDYLIQGSLPLYLASPNPLEDAYEILRKIVEVDLMHEGLSETTREKALGLLLLLASGESLAYDDLSSTLGLAKATVEKMIEKLEDLEVIFPVRAYGSLGKVARKTPKYKFLAPMLRSAVLYEFGLFERDSKTLGMLLEDAVALYLHLLAREHKLGLHYDAQRGGADFILKGHGEGVVVEVGWGKKGVRQVLRTMKKTGLTCGVVVHNGPLKKKGDVWFVPRELFLLML
ncbi:ATP-binding protein [Thermococcus sp. AM4]|uniref:ATP-binding protein n=1 Tax=Thermococcus sp. (strain AM4) TaxID=246969 RepID=UPI001ED97492|nr:ATP-binding protein [Thermococcus sp. AM4]